jgi:membrane protease YdiL (CAAX protease family)
MLTLLLTGVILLWAQVSRRWRRLGFVRPRNWPATIAIGIVLGVALKLALKAIVMPLLGVDPVNRAYHFLAGNRAAIPWALFTFVVVAGFGEETLWRGWLFERLGHVIRWKPAIVAITSVLFAAAHYADQGVAGVEQAAITGLVFGSIFAATRVLWLPMIAHAAFDLTAYAIIYFGLETRIAHALLA